MDPGRQTVETWAQVGMFHLTDWPEFKKKSISHCCMACLFCQFHSLDGSYQWTPPSLVPGSQNTGFGNLFWEVAGVHFPSPYQQED
jgi:hypothetical protein